METKGFHRKYRYLQHRRGRLQLLNAGRRNNHGQSPRKLGEHSVLKLFG
jgi:hypothetical protein